MIVRPLGAGQRAQQRRQQNAIQRFNPQVGFNGGGSRLGPAVGQMAQALGCPVFPSTMKMMSQTASAVAMNGTAELTFTTPGAFCPMKMIVFGSVDVIDVNVLSIKSGLEDQVISGPVPAGVFSIGNNCCPISCLKCLCAPGVPLVVEVENIDAMAQDITVVLIGSYLDVCPPNGTYPTSIPDVPGCPTPGSDKLLGFELTVPISSTASIELTTPGRFCPRQMFLEATFDTDLTVTNIQSGLKDQIISGALPGQLFNIDNECCILSCFDCLCAPGYPLTLGFANANAMANVVRGVLVGTYSDVCP
jgi:hypothetical protein